MICAKTFFVDVETQRCSQKLYGENHENMESGIDSRRKKLN